MKHNFFTAALESEALGTVGPEAVTNQDTLQPKPGVGEGEEVPSEDKVAKAFGEGSEFADHDDIDTVAESQEHTLALEHLFQSAMKFCRHAAALEEIAEVAEDNLAAGNPMDPSTVSMVTTALDSAGVGEPLEDNVALESFDFSATAATEGFIDVIKERAEQVWTAAAKFAKKAYEITAQKLKRFADFFRDLPGIYTKLEKEGAGLTANAGKPFQNAKWEKTIQSELFAPASTKTVLAAVSNAADEFKEVTNLAENRLHGELRALNAAWAQDKPETVVAQMNKVLATAKLLTEMGSTRFKHASLTMEVNLPERISIEGTAGLEGTRVTFEDGIQQFSAGIKTASVADISSLKASAMVAHRVIMSAMDDLFDGKTFEVNYKGRHGYEADDKQVARKLLTKYINLVRIAVDLSGGAIFGSAHGYYRNHFTATRWIRFSIAEAKQAARGSDKK